MERGGRALHCAPGPSSVGMHETEQEEEEDLRQMLTG